MVACSHVLGELYNIIIVVDCSCRILASMDAKSRSFQSSCCCSLEEEDSIPIKMHPAMSFKVSSSSRCSFKAVSVFCPSFCVVGAVTEIYTE